MAGVGVRLHIGEARQQLARMILWAKDPRPLLRAIGEYGVSLAVKRFEQGGPGWPRKNPYFAELEKRTHGSGTKPLEFRGKLRQSITFDVQEPDSVRVGSPLKYAATHQFGSDGPRTFYLHIKPDLVTGKRGKPVPERDQYGRILGRIVTPKAGEDPAAGVKRQLISIEIEERPFLVEPTDDEWDSIARMIEDYLFFGRAA